MKLGRAISRLSSTTSSTPNAEKFANRLIAITSAKELHAHLMRAYLHADPFSISQVIKSYASSAPHLPKAYLVFNQIRQPTVPIFNYIIRGFAQSDQPAEAIRLYIRMRRHGMTGNHLSLIFVFKACGRVSDIVHGQGVHVHALKLGFGLDLFVSNALIHMYALCRDLDLARKAFDEMETRDLVSWNSLICGFSQCNKFREVLAMFDAMRSANVTADTVTMVKVIMACCYLGEWEFADFSVGYIEHNCVELDVFLSNTLIDMYGQRGLVGLAQKVFDQMSERNIVSWNAMIMGYAKVGDMVEANRIFDEMPRRDVISWTSMITGYAQSSQFQDAVRLFKEMMEARVKPDKITVSSVLSACSHLGLLDVGITVHDYICQHGIQADVYVGNSLIDMYCKCGMVEKALDVFHEMKEKDSVSWTAVISGLAINGFANSAIEFFSLMLRECIQPTHGTFVGVLLACAHSGLVDEGLKYFESMEKVYGLVPEMKHYGCIVDLLSRSGYLERAYEFINKMPIAPDVTVWRILLSASKLHGNMVLAEIAQSKLLELDPGNSGNYILLSNMYSGADRWDDAIRVRGLMKEGNVQKPSGWSSIEIESVASNNFQNSSLIQSFIK